MYYLTNKKGEIIAYSTSRVDPAMKETDQEIVEVGNKMFFASQVRKIANAKKKQEKIDEINIQIADLKTELASTDYKCLKWLEGAMTDEEYAKVKAHRAGLRERINTLENERDN